MSKSRSGHAFVPALGAAIERVGLFVDGSNMMWSMPQMQPWGDTRPRDLNMGKLADVIVGKRSRLSRAEAVAVGFGVCNELVNGPRFAREMATVNRWRRDSRVFVRTSTLLHDPATGRNREKEVDMALGLDFVVAQASGLFDTVILVGGDSDFNPAIERALDNPGGAHVELARWSSQRGGPWVPGRSLWCHYLDVADFGRCTTPRGHRDAA